MKKETLLVFRINPSNMTEVRSVRFFITECPEQLSPGDTFCLEVLHGLGTAKVISRHWHGQRLVVQCEVSTFVLTNLINKGKRIPSYIDDYELTEQIWR